MKEKYKFYESLFLGIGYTWLLLLGYSYLFLVYVILKDIIYGRTFFTDFVSILMAGVLPTAIWLSLIHRGFSVIIINEEGLSRSLFKVFLKRQLNWDQIKHIRIVSRFEDRIYLSDTTLQGMKYRYLVNNKSIIHLPATKKIIDLIKFNCEIEIEKE